ncbi:Thioredoxin reductase [Desulfuromusa kysingii]|uniref:Thioredoxin reductase n=1 Tax=Desulfuromusa kysingii TaxID=37625 RepID=A0A1H3ZZA1_9BACT|nr:FAD-dependent oxidoreductase [Desulfuromusa kysingii]SEA29026.1 Thioredoxin reductase [Desulfuromusa kysingii]
MSDPLNGNNYDVVIIGAGPAGLSAALTLKKSGIESVLVVDRDSEAGGAPRHCGHPPFGIREYKRIMTGPSFAKRLVQSARDNSIKIALKTTVTMLQPAGNITVSSPEGMGKITAKRVLIATGIRETPRSSRLVSGDRPLGICTTGTLQSMYYLKKLIPFRYPVIVGTEIVSFSALSTCKKAGIKPVAMLEENQRPTLRWPLYYAAQAFGVPLLLQTQIVKIIGDPRVRAVYVAENKGNIREIACDGVLFSGQFTPESTLARMSHLDLDYATNSPIVDQFGRCTDPTYYAAGNVLQHATGKKAPIYYNPSNLPQPVDVAGKCWDEGQITAQWIVQDLAGNLPQ